MMRGFAGGILTTIGIAIIILKALGLILTAVSWGWIVAALLLIAGVAFVFALVAAVPANFV